MKLFKRVSAVAMCAVLVSSVAVTALATEVTKPTSAASTPVDVNEHTFVAYQIFTADYEAGTDYLTNVKWGSNIKVVDFINALKTSDVLKTYFEDVVAENTDESADAVAKVLNDNPEVFSSDTADKYSAETRAFAKLADQYRTGDAIATTATVPAGYYLIVDTTTITDPDAFNLSLLNMVTDGALNITSKADYPMLEKKVYENSYASNDKSTAGDRIKNEGLTYGEGFNDTADYEIGETVYFELLGTVASNYDEYKTYFYEFNDSMGTGLTNQKNYNVYVLNANSTGEYPVQNDKGTYDTADANVTLVDSSKYVVTDDTSSFSIKFENLKDVAEVKSTSIIAVEYTAVLNDSAVLGRPGNKNTGSLTFSNNPNYKGDGSDDQKEDKSKTPDDTVIVFTYKVTGTKKDSVTKNPLTGAEFTLTSAKTNKSFIITYGDDGTFSAKGLDAGKYTLTETKAPDGYRLLSQPIEVELKSGLLCVVDPTKCQTWDVATDAEAKEALKSLTAELNCAETVAAITSTDTDKCADAGEIKFDVFNTKTFILPFTGSTGTMMIYVAGLALVVLAAVMIIKKRAKN